MKKGCLPHGR